MPFFGRSSKTNKTGVAQKVIKAHPGHHNQKRKRPTDASVKETVSKRPAGDDEITSEEEEEEEEEHLFQDFDEEETAQEKKVRLAKAYLEQIKEQNCQQADDNEFTGVDDAVSRHLKDEVLEAAGRLKKEIADTLSSPDPDSIYFLKCNKQRRATTCIALAPLTSIIFSGSKDGSVIRWDLQTKEKIFRPGGRRDQLQCHSSSVLCIAVSSDMQYLATGDAGGNIIIWNPGNLEYIGRLGKHKGAVSGLVFRKQTSTLYSCSHDRLVMVWNVGVMTFVEFIEGHHDIITGIDAHTKESCITSGGSDQSVIIYDIVDEKQIHFKFKLESSIDSVKLLDDRFFITAGTKQLALWTVSKRSPVFHVKNPHGQNTADTNWILALAVLHNSDLVATGSTDGFVRLWKASTKESRIEPLYAVPVEGIVNGLEFTSSASHLIAAVGKEHKLGRLFVNKSARNCLIVIPLKAKS